MALRDLSTLGRERREFRTWSGGRGGDGVGRGRPIVEWEAEGGAAVSVDAGVEGIGIGGSWWVSKKF